ncbi:MAG: cytochrome P450 [Vicinamibacterales bacterium]
MLKVARDHVSWLFFPHRFLYAAQPAPRYLRVPGWETLRFVASQEEVAAVTRATGEVFLGGAGNEFLEALLGPQSVFLLDGDRHRMARRIAGEALSRTSRGPSYAQAVSVYVEEAIDGVAAGRLTRVGPWARRLTMRAVSLATLGSDDETMAGRLFRAFESTTGFAANIVSYTKWMWLPRGPFSVGAMAARFAGRVDRILYPEIAARRQAGAHGTCPLDALIRGQAEHGYDDRFIRDNVVALLAAGYETTGAAIAWMLYWLSQPDLFVRARTRREAGDREYLTAFRNECLRYCPPVDLLPRKIAPHRLAEAVALLPDLDKWVSVDPGSGERDAPVVCPFVHRIHHDASVHDHPAEFDPGRFVGRSYPPTAFLPFGLGRRFCLGAAVGQDLMDRVLDRLLARDLCFEFLSRTFAPVRRNVIIWPGALLLARLRPGPRTTP